MNVLPKTVTRLRLLAVLVAVLAVLVALLAGELADPTLAGAVDGTPAAGAVDTSFGTNGYVTVSIGSWVGASAVAVQPDGRIVTAGEAEINGTNVIVSTRMTPSGQLDPSYGNGGIVTVPIYGGAGVDSGAGIALQPDGKIVLAGGGRSGPTGPIGFAAVRLLPNGSLDPSFGAGGVAVVPIGTEAIANAVVIEPDGAIALAGSALVGQDEFAALRLNSNGTLDQGFGSGGIVTLPTSGAAWGMALQPDGKLLLGGQSKSAGTQVMVAIRLLGDGTLDPGFGAGGVVTLAVGSEALGYAIALQPNGEIVLAGSAVTSTGVAVAARLDPNGTLDQSFGNAGLATVADWQGVNGITLDAFGRIVLPAVGPSAVRFNADGSTDTSFGSGGIAAAPIGTRGGANGAAIGPDGEIVLAGAAEINGQTVLAVTRLWPGAAPATAGQTVTPVLNGVPSVVQTVGSLVAPRSTSAPRVTGSAWQGQPLGATRGAWNRDPTSWGYAWQRCDRLGLFCKDIPAATASKYVPTLLDVGHALRVVVTAGNSAGATAASSAPTADVNGLSTVPMLSGVSLKPRRVAKGRAAVLRLVASEPSSVAVAIRRIGPHAPRSDMLRFSAKQGHDWFTLRTARLRPGRYAIEVRARDSAGHNSRRHRLTLIVERR